MPNLADLLRGTRPRFPARPALKLDDATTSYEALDDASARVAGLLRSKGVGPGDRVGIMLPNVPYFAIVYYGVLRAGGVVVPMNVLLKGREVSFYLTDPEAKVLFAWHQFAEDARIGADEAGAELVVVDPKDFADVIGAAEPATEYVDRAEDDTAVILY